MLLREVVTAAGFLTTGFRQARAQTVCASFVWRWSRSGTHPADAGFVAVLDDDLARRVRCGSGPWRAIELRRESLHSAFSLLSMALGRLGASLQRLDALLGR